jgi:hypothetical protein
MLKHVLMILAVAMSGGCASHATLTGQSGLGATAGVLAPTWPDPHTLVVQLDGKHYAGEWSSSPCFTDECRGVFRNVLRIHRRHIRKGEAILAAPDGVRLECRWVAYLSKVDGMCRGQGGQVYKLKSAKVTQAAQPARSTA